ncbi:MAG: hypothetical protein RL518_1346 [Pseudomonadota bacterium]
MLTKFPVPLTEYGDEHLSGLWAVLLHRIEVEPLNLFATVIFLCAIIHTFSASWFLRLAKRREERDHIAWLERADGAGEGEPPLRFSTVLLHYLGELEAVFGLWIVPLIVAITVSKGWEVTKHILEHSIQFDEAVFVVVIMAIASSHPLLYIAERVLAAIARVMGGTPAAWWATILIVGPIFGSLITEPAAMTICALLLGQHFYRYKPSKTLAYASVGLLFANISVGGVLTNFAAPPVVIVAAKWNWDTPFMFVTFGWKALAAVLFSTLAYLYLFRREFQAMAKRVSPFEASHPVLEKPTPIGVVVVNLLFMAWTVVNANSPHLVIGGFLFFLAFVDATRHFQRAVSLRMPLLVGFFLAGLVVHGTFQAWWIEPLLMRLSEGSLLLSSVFLSAFNDNAAITYLASLVPHFSDDLRYLVLSGAVAAGGLTVLANAPNPAGNALLSRYFEGGISQSLLFLAAIFPLAVNLMFFVSFR